MTTDWISYTGQLLFYQIDKWSASKILSSTDAFIYILLQGPLREQMRNQYHLHNGRPPEMIRKHLLHRSFQKVREGANLCATNKTSLSLDLVQHKRFVVDYIEILAVQVSKIIWVLLLMDYTGKWGSMFRGACSGASPRRNCGLHTFASAENVVLVESPAKAKKIQTFLGPAFQVAFIATQKT